MTDNVSIADISDTLEKIVSASRNQPGNQEEILKLLKQIPTLSKSILPIVYNAQPMSSAHSDVLRLFQYISKYLISELKQLVQGTVTNIDRPKHTCVCLENLTLLAGHEFAKEKFTEVVSHATYLLIQENMEFVENPVENLPQVAKSLVSLIQNIKPFALDMYEALFLCEALNMTCGEQRNWISNVILEKLSTELLTIIDALKEFADKPSSNKVTNFLQVDPSPLEDPISTTNLLSLGSLLDAFNELEMSLHGGIASKVQKLRNSSDKFKKSSLKHRLPDILRSSQETGWMRSRTMFGEWDWQEILRDIAPSIAKSITEAFENFHTMISLKHSQCDEAYQVNLVTSLSSDWLSGKNSPKKTISEFKEAVSLIKSTLPYGVIGSHYKPLSCLLSCYIDECSQCLKMLKSYLSMLLNDFPEKVTASDIFCTIAACEDVTVTLQYCSANINTDVRAPFQGICQLYCDMNKTLKSAVVQYLCTRIQLNILHDGESNHFSDPKEFADGECCSFSVENWKNFLGRMRKEMDSTLSIPSRNEILSKIFLDSLNVLKMRYLRCEPSYNRAKQLYYDIPCIISTCEEYLSLSDRLTSPKQALFTDCDRAKISSICELLHGIMIIINVPLSVLRNCLSKKRADERSERRTQSKSTVVRFLESQIDDQDTLVQCMVALLSNDMSFLCLVRSDDFAEELGTANAQTFHHCLYEVLSSGVSLWCGEFFNCALMSVNNDHDLLLRNCIINSISHNYSWQTVFFHKLDNVLCKSLVTAVSFLSQPCWSCFMKNVISSFPSNVKATVSDMASKEDNMESRLIVSVILILLSLKNALHMLPEWLTRFLMKLKSKSTKQNENDITAIKVILNETARILNNPDIWEEHCHLDLNKDGINAMQRVSSLISQFYSKNFRPRGIGDEVVMHFFNSLCKEADECFRLMPEIDFHYSDDELYQECKLEVADMQDSGENALNSLQSIDKLLKDNADWLQSSWAKSHCDKSIFKSLRSLQNLDEKCLAALSAISWKTVKTIILRRWEAKAGASLTDEQAENLDMIMQTLEQNEDAY